MADGLNRCTIIGNLGKDPEMRYTPGGAAVTTFSVAVGRSYKRTNDEQKVEETEWFSVVCWNQLAELVGQYLVKGRKVYVEGRMQTRSWDQDGSKRYRTELIAQQVIFLDKAPAGQGGDFAPDDDDLPFN